MKVRRYSIAVQAFIISIALKAWCKLPNVIQVKMFPVVTWPLVEACETKILADRLFAGTVIIGNF